MFKIHKYLKLKPRAFNQCIRRTLKYLNILHYSINEYRGILISHKNQHNSMLF